MIYLESLRIELRPFEIKVVAILPGFVKTAMTANKPYPMPSLISSSCFAKKAIKVIRNGRRFAIILWPMRILTFLLRLLPKAFFDYVFSKTPRKHKSVSQPIKLFNSSVLFLTS